MFAAGSPDYKELALVLADSLPPPTAPPAAGLPPNVLLTKIGVSYFTSENPLLYILFVSKRAYYAQIIEYRCLIYLLSACVACVGTSFTLGVIVSRALSVSEFEVRDALFI